MTFPYLYPKNHDKKLVTADQQTQVAASSSLTIAQIVRGAKSLTLQRSLCSDQRQWAKNLWCSGSKGCGLIIQGNQCWLWIGINSFFCGCLNHRYVDAVFASIYICRLYIYIYILHLNKLQGPHVATVTFEMVRRGNFYPREACKVFCAVLVLNRF